MVEPPMTATAPSPATHALDRWLAGSSLLLGSLAVLGVLCFHFPDLLTSQQFRDVYTEGFARHLMAVGLLLAFVTGTLAVLRGGARRTALAGVGLATLAVLAGGATVQFDPIEASPWSLGLDWFVLSLLFSALVFVPIERLLGQRAQSPLRPEWRTDLGYFFIGHVGIQFLLIAITASSQTMAALAAWPPLQASVGELPLWIAFPLAVVVADLAQSLLHRAYHRVPFLWRFHAVHHSVRHLDWLAGSRMHVVEILLTRTLVLLPLLALGFPQAAINAYVILVGLQAVLAHANLGIRFGWLEHVLVLPRYHHWHHARDPACVDANYAIHLPVIDRLFGTHRLPKDGSWPREFGLLDLDEMPAGIWRQHLQPFRRRKRGPARARESGTPSSAEHAE
jgi:sterol desaturase/sphingolipid hydroxylase (fatty acid hydroxylase superfamily)